MEEEASTNENETNSSVVEFDKLKTEFRDAFVPDALSKFFDTDGPQTAAIKNDQEAHACHGLVTMTDVHGLHVVAGIVYQTLTNFENWLYETEAGKDFQRVILQELPDLKEPLEVGLRDLFRVLAPVLRQLQDKSHPHFQDIERWYSNYHLLVKAAVSFLHGGIARLRNRGSGQGNGSLDLSIIAIKILSIPQVENFIETLRAQCMMQSAAIQLRSLNLQIPEVVRLAVEERIGGILRFLQEVIQLKDPSNPIFRKIESWFENADVLVQIVLDFLHGAILGFLNNEASEGFGALDLEGILKEMQKAKDDIETSWHNWFCRLIETESGRDLLKIISLEWLYPIRPNDNGYRETVNLFGASLIGMKDSPNLSLRPIERLLAEDTELLSFLVTVFHDTLAWFVNSGNGFISPPCLLHFEVLRILNEINEKNGYPVSRRQFWLQGLESGPHLIRDLMLYAISTETHQKLSTWLDVPFLLNVRTKWKFVSLEAIITAERDMRKADEENRVRREAQAPIIPTSLQFDVDRDDIVQSAIDNVDKYWNCEENSESVCIWLMPIVVNFRRESAIDLGGPSKDFFHHLFSALLDSGTSMFRKLDEQATSTDVWFNQGYLDYDTLEKIGLLFALSIYNEAVTTVPFPEQLYEKLLSNRDPDVSDLKKMDGDFVKQLHGLRDLREEDVKALELDFSDLRPNGETIDVSKENLEEYIDEMVYKRLAIPQLTSFARGFNKIASKTPLMKSIFKAEDLRDVVLGEELDWNAFKLSAIYQSPYVPDHPVIKMFWKVFGELDERNKRQFLKFLTGADHVPIGGFVPFPIRRLNNLADKYRNPVHPDKYPEPGQLMPEVMTCRGYLSMDLPEYESEEDLRFRLKLAIQTSGFHREGQHASSATTPYSPMMRQLVRFGAQLMMGGRR